MALSGRSRPSSGAARQASWLNPTSRISRILGRRLRRDGAPWFQGRTLSAGDWVPLRGPARLLRDVLITADKTVIPAVLLKHPKGMKEAWCIATNRVDLGAAGVVKLYARRFTIEETFRDIEDNHVRMGLSATHIHSAPRRDRLLLLAAVAQALLTLRGAAGEACGLDRTLKANTVKTRTMSARLRRRRAVEPGEREHVRRKVRRLKAIDPGYPSRR